MFGRNFSKNNHYDGLPSHSVHQDCEITKFGVRGGKMNFFQDNYLHNYFLINASASCTVWPITKINSVMTINKISICYFLQSFPIQQHQCHVGHCSVPNAKHELLQMREKHFWNLTLTVERHPIKFFCMRSRSQLMTHVSTC